MFIESELCTCFKPYLLFPLINFVILSNLKGIICTPKLHYKNIGHGACSQVKDHHTSLTGPFIGKQYGVLRMCACLFAWLLDFYVQYRMRSAILRNHPK